MMIAKGQRYRINCDLKKANGEWQVMNIHLQSVLLGRLHKDGRLASCSKQNILSLPLDLLTGAIERGTAQRMEQGS